MFTAEVRINGHIIITISGINTGITTTAGNKYEFEYFEPSIGSLTHETVHVKGSVFHKKELGFRSLLMKILKKVDK